MRDVDPALFPNVVRALRDAGIDPERELVPVAPAAHYMMGGIATDLDGRSTLPGLYAVGECSCTGLHGANRLASNSLSECFVFGARAARSAAAQPEADPRGSGRAAREPAAGPTAGDLARQSRSPVATRRARARREGPEPARGRPAPARAADRRAARWRGPRAAGRTSGPTSRTETPPSTDCHVDRSAPARLEAH